MKISSLNTRITIEENVVVSDTIGNRTNEWREYYSCFATIKIDISGSSENSEVGLVIDHNKLNFLIRYCNKVKNINSTNYRVVFQDEIYDIKAVDLMNLKKKSIKLVCKKVDR